MAYNKKHDRRKPFKMVLCVDDSGCKYLYSIKYGVLEENETRYLIQFESRSAKWYSKERFEDIITTPEPKQDLFNQLF